MDQARPRAEPHPTPRLYLVTPRVSDAAAFADELAPVLGAADVAAVLVRLAEGDDATLIVRVKTLAPVVQQNGAALILAGHAELVASSGADGAHVSGIDAFSAALPMLKPRHIAGAGGLASRHDAMLAAEAGADYVMFGDPDATGSRPPFEAVEERVAWWAEVFEIPCVGFAASLEEVAALARVGADFIGLGEFAFADPSGPVAAVRAASRLLVAEPV